MRSYRTTVLLVLVSTSTWAQSTYSNLRPPSICATGEGVVQVKPDEAKIDIGVVTEAQTAQAAATQNATQLQSAIDGLKAALGDRAEIRTTGYALNPVYSYPQNGKPVIKGYRASNTVEVTTGDLAHVGKVIDAATQGGANNIARLQFTLKNEAPARAQALHNAVMEARSNAEAMAAAMGVKLGKLLSLVQNGAQTPIRPMLMEAARVGGAPTPVEPDTIEVRAAVTLTLAVE